MPHRSFFMVLLIIYFCSPLFCAKDQQQSENIFDQLDQFEYLVEETDTATRHLKDAKIPLYAEFGMKIGSWLFVQYHAASQTLAAWYKVLVNGVPDNENN